MGSKTAALHRNHHYADRPVWVTGILLFVWMISSVASTVTNKTLMTIFPYSATLTLVQITASCVVDYIIILYRRLSILPLNRPLLIQTLPVAASINFSKTLTYVSYGYVPASLTHTAKASSPIFSVALSKLLYNKAPSMYIVLSLIPITVGVTLSALTELNFALFGFIAAVAASVAAVLNSIYGKQALHHISCPDPIIFHFYTSVCAVLMVLPWVLYNDLYSIYMSVHTTTSIINVDGITSIITRGIPYQLIILSLAMHYLQNISSIYYLAGVTVLTHQVASTMKRLMVIASTVVYFGNPVGIMNAVGMGIAVCGYFCYGLAKQFAADLHQEHYQHENAVTHTSPHHHSHSGRRLSTDVELEPIMIKRSLSSSTSHTPQRSPPLTSRVLNRLNGTDSPGANNGNTLHAMMNGNSQHTHHSLLPHRSPQPSLPGSANLGTHVRRHSNTTAPSSLAPSPVNELERNEVRLDITAPNDKSQMNGTYNTSTTNGTTLFQPPTTTFEAIREVSSSNDLTYFHRTDSEGNLPYFLHKHTPHVYDSRSNSPVPTTTHSHSQTLPLTKANMMRHEPPQSQSRMYEKLRRNDRSETALSEASTASNCSNDSLGLV